MKHQTSPVPPISDQARYLWIVVAHAAEIEDRVEAAIGLRNLAVKKNNFDDVLGAIDLDQLQRLIQYPSVDNRALNAELKVLRKTLTAHSFTDVKEIDLTPILPTLSLSREDRLDALNDFAAILQLKVKLDDDVVQPVWQYRALLIDKVGLPHAYLTLDSKDDCSKLQSLLRKVNIESKYGTKTDGPGYGLYIQEKELHGLTARKRDWFLRSLAAEPMLEVLNTMGKPVDLSARRKIDGQPCWKFNLDTNTSDKVFVYLEAIRDHAFLSYSDGLRAEGIAHTSIRRGRNWGALTISQDQFFEMSPDSVKAVNHLYIKDDGLPHEHQIVPASIGNRSYRALQSYGYES